MIHYRFYLISFLVPFITFSAFSHLGEEKDKKPTVPVSSGVTRPPIDVGTIPVPPYPTHHVFLPPLIAEGEYPTAVRSSPFLVYWAQRGEDVSSELNTTYRAIDLRRRSFENQTFEGEIFDFSDLREARFTRCTFHACRFIGVNLEDSTFSHCTFNGAYWYRVNSQRTNMIHCSLTGSFQYVNFSYSVFDTVRFGRE